MPDFYLLGVQIETPEGKFLENGVLKVGKEDLKLIISRTKGIALSGLVLVSLWMVLVFALASPFLFLQAPPITMWDALSAGLFVLAIPVGFVTTFFIGTSLGRRIQVKFPKSEKNVTVLDSINAPYRVLELVVQSDEERFVLVTSRIGGNTSKAMTYLRPESGRHK